ncbi:MAG: phosphatidate cytidylyltransferase, partial [Fusobacterium sp.]|nr:phosphatidate cytidylyltransferase [Fusobacterium sp.]
MFKWNRVLVALIGVPLLVFIYTNRSFNGIPLLIFTNLVVGIGTHEFYKMIKNMNKNVEAELGIFISLLIVNLKYFSYNRAFRLANMMATKYDVSDLLMLTVITILVLRVFKNQIEGTVEAVANTLAGIVYVGVLFSPIIDIYMYGLNHNPAILLAIQILVWASDTFAGIVGVSIGRKFFKNGFTKISPKKSVEGALGSLILTGLLASFTCYYFLGEKIIYGFI